MAAERGGFMGLLGNFLERRRERKRRKELEKEARESEKEKERKKGREDPENEWVEISNSSPSPSSPSPSPSSPSPSSPSPSSPSSLSPSPSSPSSSSSSSPSSSSPSGSLSPNERKKEEKKKEKEEEEEEEGGLRLSALMMECSICYCETPLDDMMEVEKCMHVFCKECIKGHCEAKQQDGETEVCCPQLDCDSFLSQHELKLALGERDFDTLDRRALEQAVAIDPTLHLCPTPDCLFVISWCGPEEGPPKIDCPLCKCSRCLICGLQPYHAGLACDDPSLVSPSESEKKEAEEATMKFIAHSNIKLCPRCKNGVVKESGCDKLKCRCGYRSCWRCGSENAQCPCTPSNHGYIDNVTGGGDFSSLRSKISPT